MDDFTSIRDWAAALLLGDRVRLRSLEANDLPSLTRWWKDPANAVLQHDTLVLPTDESTAATFETWSKNDTPGAAGYAITTHAGELVGHIALWGATPPVMISNLAILIGGEYQQHGYGRDAMRIALRLAFEELGVHKVEVEVWEYNARARSLYASLGFTEEGVRRAAAYHRSTYSGLAIMGMLREEYDAVAGDAPESLTQ